MKKIDPLKATCSMPWLIILMLATHSAATYAMPSFARQFKHQYGYIPSCQACHKDGGGSPLNDYGQAFKDNGENNAAFTLIATLDSDKDGFNNGLEASQKANPGNIKSTPSDPGEWLDLSSLIPKAVQKLFPDATAWKPLDAILTDKDILRAKTMDVTLSSEDENTIYIPVANRRPIGTALIFPVNYQSKTFFLLMTTDRELNISTVTPLNDDQLPSAINPELLEAFIGSPLQSVPLQEGKTLEAGIGLAVKRAGVLIYIRLKGA
ncbi:MAG: hypothetical protein ACI9T9_000612 [Oleiphilaceae bacterium]